MTDRLVGTFAALDDVFAVTLEGINAPSTPAPIVPSKVTVRIDYTPRKGTTRTLSMALAQAAVLASALYEANATGNPGAFGSVTLTDGTKLAIILALQTSGVFTVVFQTSTPTSATDTKQIVLLRDDARKLRELLERAGEMAP